MATRRTDPLDPTPILPEGVRAERTRQGRRGHDPRVDTVSENSLEPVTPPQAARRRAAKDKQADNESTPTNPARVLPEAIAERYVRAGNRFHFANRDLAFTDHGNRLSTGVTNTEVIQDLIEIAKARGWNEIKLSGSKEFQQEAWVRANVSGVTVRNYRASELDREMLRRRQGRSSEEAAPPSSNSVAAAETASTQRVAEQQVDRVAPYRASTSARVPSLGESFTGRLVKHGVESGEYTVELRVGNREIALRGDDLRRATAESLSKPQPNDEVTVRYFGPEQVRVARFVRGEDGEVIREAVDVSTVNRWAVERSNFVRERQELARVVRDTGVDVAQAVRKHPSLAGTYAELGAAEQVAELKFPQSVADQQRFKNTAREKLAEEIDRGRPMPVSRLPREPRELVQERTM